MKEEKFILIYRFSVYKSESRVERGGKQRKVSSLKLEEFEGLEFISAEASKECCCGP